MKKTSLEKWLFHIIFLNISIIMLKLLRCQMFFWCFLFLLSSFLWTCNDCDKFFILQPQLFLYTCFFQIFLLYGFKLISSVFDILSLLLIFSPVFNFLQLVSLPFVLFSISVTFLYGCLSLTPFLSVGFPSRVCRQALEISLGQAVL